LLNNLKIGKKLGLGFGVVLFLLTFVSFYSFYSFEDVKSLTDDAGQANNHKTFMVEKEVDHLKWMAQLSELFLDDHVNTVTVQTDDHKCGLGKWLYGDEARKLAEADPQIAVLLKKIEEPHHRLHNTAIDIGNTYVDFDLEIKTLFANRWIDHLSWMNNLGQSILLKQDFSGGLDPHQCAFGKWYYAYQATNPEFAELLKKWETPHEHLHHSAEKIVEAQKNGDYAKAIDTYETVTIPVLKKLHRVYEETGEWIEQMATKREEAHRIYTEKTNKAVTETQGILGELKHHFNKTAEDNTETMNAGMNSTVKILIILTIVGILIGLAAAYVITRGIARPVSYISNIAEEISTGNIQHNIEINSKDEIGVLADSFRKLITYMKNLAGAAESIANNNLTYEVTPQSEKDVLGNSFKTMIANLTGMVRQLNDNARELVSAANEISSSSEQMSRGAQDQNTQVSQVSSAVEEMTATIIQSSKNAGEATDASRGASDTATSGGQVVNETIHGMQTIAQVVRESADSIGKLAKSADQIGNIIGVINDVADQTNLLALNAAIEAARAGEHGRGFAVVADEVRKLAERTGKATGEITDMIKGIQNETNEAVQSMESGIQEVDKGRELADQAGNSLNEIVTMTQRVMDMIQQIATASEEQSTAAEQISKNIENISSVTKETATGAEQSAAAAEELNRQAEGLQQMVARFKVKHEEREQIVSEKIPA